MFNLTQFANIRFGCRISMTHCLQLEIRLLVKANGIVNVCLFVFVLGSLTQAKHQAQMHLFHQEYTIEVL